MLIDKNNSTTSVNLDILNRFHEIECRLNLLEHAARCERNNYISLQKDLEGVIYANEKM